MFYKFFKKLEYVVRIYQIYKFIHSEGVTINYLINKINN